MCNFLFTLRLICPKAGFGKQAGQKPSDYDGNSLGTTPLSNSSGELGHQCLLFPLECVMSSSRANRGLRLVRPPSEKPPLPYFRAGEPITETGIYRVFHSEHRVSHEVTLLAGQAFPTCADCGRDVHFELLRSAPAISRDPSFRINLYVVPHPSGEESDGAVEVAAVERRRVS